MKNPEYKRISDNFSKLLSHNDLMSTETLESIRFFGDMFCKTENKLIAYKITSAFYNYLQGIDRETNWTQMGCLSSANTDGAGLNLVLKKDLVDNRILKCTNVVMWAIKRAQNDSKHLNVFPITDAVVPDDKGNFHFPSIR